MRAASAELILNVPDRSRQNCYPQNQTPRLKAVKILIEKIVSGGQTGADRAALDWAIESGIPHGGWCPKGRLAEDGPISARYNLTESTSSNYVQRTEWNVRDSDGTVVFSIAPTLTGGSKKTVVFAQKHKRPVIHISSKAEQPGEKLLEFIRTSRVRVLNVAGHGGQRNWKLVISLKMFWEQRFCAVADHEPTLNKSQTFFAASMTSSVSERVESVFFAVSNHRFSSIGSGGSPSFISLSAF